MALITDHATLLAAVADTLNRTDLTSVIPNFIQQAHDNLSLDPRVRQQKVASYSLTADDLAFPTDMDGLISLVHDGGTYYGDLETVDASQLPGLKAQYGLTGPPAYVAILDSTFRFAPAPDATYTLKITYWATLTSIVSAANWLLTAHPSIYLYATLCESAPYLKDDQRLQVWQTMLEDRLEKLHLEQWNRQFGGSLRRQFSPIGG